MGGRKRKHNVKRFSVAEARADALSYYEDEGIDKRKARKVIDAFLAKGFTMEDIGGGDILWVCEMQTGAGFLNLEVQPVDEKLRFIEDLDNIVHIQVINDHDGGFYLTGGSASTLLRNFGTFNVE